MIIQCVHKNQSHKIFTITLLKSDEILQNSDDLHPESWTQCGLHFRVCVTPLTRDVINVIFEWPFGHCCNEKRWISYHPPSSRRIHWIL